jgi:hypothetical protein
MPVACGALNPDQRCELVHSAPLPELLGAPLRLGNHQNHRGASVEGIAMIRGCCLCGGIRFETDAARSLTHCHCNNCRKLSGAAFASYVHVDTDKFRFISGEELIQRFESAPGSFRNFCRVCSSTVPGKAAYLTTVSIPAGLFDDDPGVRPKLHVFVSSKVPWWEIADGLPQHDRWVPGYSPQGQT